MLALHTGLQVSQQGIADGVGAAGDGLEQAAAAHDDVQGLGVTVFLLQEVQNDLLAEVLLVDDAGVLGDLLGRVAQRFSNSRVSSSNTPTLVEVEPGLMTRVLMDIGNVSF